MQMNIYFESTAWVLFLGGLRQQESERRAGGGMGGSVSLGIVRSVWGLQAEQSRLLTIVLMLLDPLISKYETWRVKKKNQKRKEKSSISAMNNRWRLNSICIQYILVPGTSFV